MLFSNKVSPTFAKKVSEISSRLNINPDWLMFVMNNESGLKANIVNSIGCTGLIQFCKNTPETLGTTMTALKNMSAETQLDWVEKYYRYWYKALGISKCNSVGDLYMLTFMPAFVNKGNDIILQTKNLSASAIAKANPSFNTDKNGYISVGEFRRWVENQYKKVGGDLSVTKTNSNIFPIIATLTGIVLIGIYFYKKNN